MYLQYPLGDFVALTYNGMSRARRLLSRSLDPSVVISWLYLPSREDWLWCSGYIERRCFFAQMWGVEAVGGLVILTVSHAEDQPAQMLIKDQPSSKGHPICRMKDTMRLENKREESMGTSEQHHNCPPAV